MKLKETNDKAEKTAELTGQTKEQKRHELKKVSNCLNF